MSCLVTKIFTISTHFRDAGGTLNEDAVQKYQKELEKKESKQYYVVLKHCAARQVLLTNNSYSADILTF